MVSIGTTLMLLWLVRHGGAAKASGFHLLNPVFGTLLAVSLLPAALGLAGWCYLLAALGLGARFVCLAQSMHRGYSPSVSRAVFVYSIRYLSGIFAALLFDHYVFWPLA